jgi:hypothetical protein
MTDNKWTEWYRMPESEKCRKILGPKNSGIYQIRNRQTDEFILFGIGKYCQKRMKSLYPAPFGAGKRNNKQKREYVLENWKELEYRTMETGSRLGAKEVEDIIKAEKNHLFNT